MRIGIKWGRRAGLHRDHGGREPLRQRHEPRSADVARDHTPVRWHAVHAKRLLCHIDRQQFDHLSSLICGALVVGAEWEASIPMMPSPKR